MEGQNHPRKRLWQAMNLLRNGKVYEGAPYKTPSERRSGPYRAKMSSEATEAAKDHERPLRRSEGVSACQSEKQGQRTADADHGRVIERPKGRTDLVGLHGHGLV